MHLAPGRDPRCCRCPHLALRSIKNIEYCRVLFSNSTYQAGQQSLFNWVSEFHLAVKWLLLVVLDKLNERVELSIADAEHASFLANAAVLDLALSTGRWICVRAVID